MNVIAGITAAFDALDRLTLPAGLGVRAVAAALGWGPGAAGTGQFSRREP